MAAGGNDGSLRFDTAINIDGFEDGISTLSKAMDRLTKAVDRLSSNILSRFNGAGQALAETASSAEKTSDAVESVGNAADKSAAQVKSLQEQMDAISVHTMQNNAADVQSSAPVAVPVSSESMSYDPKAMATVFGEAAADIRRWGEAVEQYGQQAGMSLNNLKQDSVEAEQAVANAAGQGEEQAQTYIGVKESVSNAFKGVPRLFRQIPMAAAKELAKIPGITKNAFAAAALTVSSFGKALGSSLTNKVKQAVSSLKTLGKSSNKVSQSILKLSNMFKLMLIRMAMRAAIQGVKEGMQNLVQYSDSANQSMSGLMTNMTYLKNSFAAAFAPILSYVAPALNTLINLLATAVSYINQFFSALGGGSTYIRAKKANEDYAASLKKTGGAASKAGKDAKKALAPFDDLVQIQQQSKNDSEGGGGGASPSDMFETIGIDQGISDFADKLKEMFAAGDWEGIGQLIGQKINEAVQSFTEFISWDNVGVKITAFVTAFTTMFNSLVATIDWYAIGIMMGTGINTLANTLYLLLTQIDWFMLGNALGIGLMGMIDTVDWNLFGATIGVFFQAQISGLLGYVLGADWGAIGTAIATCFMGITRKIDWAMLGLLFADGLSAAFAVLGNFALTFDWVEFGSSLALSLSTFFQNFDWTGAGTAISDIVIGMLNALTTFITETDWWAFGEGVATALEHIDWSTVANRLFMAIGAALGGIAAFLGGLISDGVTAAQEYFQRKIEECGGNVVDGIFKGIIDAMAAVGTWIQKNVFKPFIDAFKSAFGIHSPSKAMAEMGQYLWDGFCNGIKEFFSNPGAFIKQHITDPFVNGVKSLLGIHSPSTVLQEVGGYTVSGFNKGVENGQGSTQNIVQSWASGVASWFSSKLGISGGDSAEAQKWADSTMTGYNNTVGKNYVKSQSVMEKWAENVRKWFVASGDAKGVNMESWKKFADDIIRAFAEEITSKHTDTQEPAETWAEDVRKWFVGESESQGINEASWTKFADLIIQAFKTKIEGSHAETQEPMENWAKNIREWFWGDSNTGGTGGMYDAFYHMAKRINEGFANGISDFAYMANNAIKKWAREAMEEAEEEFDINSPSKEFHTIAEYVVRGFNDGIADMAASSRNTVQKWLDGVMDVFDGVEVQLPIGINIPNAAAYLPRMASGGVVPPRAGEMSAGARNMAGYGQEETLGYLVARMDDVISRLRTEGNGPIQIVLNLTGNLAALARILKPELDKEASRKGVSLVITGGA